MDVAVERCVSFESPALEALPGFDVIRNVTIFESEDSTFVDQTDTSSEDSVSKNAFCLTDVLLDLVLCTNL